MTTTPTPSTHWPPRCGVPSCVEPSTAGPVVALDLGTAGTPWVQPCARHREQGEPYRPSPARFLDAPAKLRAIGVDLDAEPPSDLDPEDLDLDADDFPADFDPRGWRHFDGCEADDEAHQDHADTGTLF